MATMDFTTKPCTLLKLSDELDDGAHCWWSLQATERKKKKSAQISEKATMVDTIDVWGGIA